MSAPSEKRRRVDSPSSQQGRDYHKRWCRLDDDHWKSFHKDWWANDERVDAGSIVHVRQERVWHALQLLEDSGGAILVRAEYLDLYTKDYAM